MITVNFFTSVLQSMACAITYVAFAINLKCQLAMILPILMRSYNIMYSKSNQLLFYNRLMYTAYPHNNYHSHMHHLARQFLIGVSVPSKRSFFYPSAAVEAAVSMRIVLFYLDIRMTVCKKNCNFIITSVVSWNPPSTNTLLSL